MNDIFKFGGICSAATDNRHHDLAPPAWGGQGLEAGPAASGTSPTSSWVGVLAGSAVDGRGELPGPSTAGRLRSLCRLGLGSAGASTAGGRGITFLSSALGTWLGIPLCRNCRNSRTVAGRKDESGEPTSACLEGAAARCPAGEVSADVVVLEPESSVERG